MCTLFIGRRLPDVPPISSQGWVLVKFIIVAYAISNRYRIITGFAGRGFTVYGSRPFVVIPSEASGVIAGRRGISPGLKSKRDSSPAEAGSE
jgi:hypothetical protein